MIRKIYNAIQLADIHLEYSGGTDKIMGGAARDGQEIPMVAIQMKPEIERPGWVASSESKSSADQFHWQVSSHQHAWRPPTDVYISDDAVIVRVEIAGMRDGDFSITYEDQTLSIHGSRPDFPERRAFHQMEIRFGDFRTDIRLHWPVDIDGVDAEYKDGFLRVMLPIEKPQNIEIQE